MPENTPLPPSASPARKKKDSPHQGAAKKRESGPDPARPFPASEIMEKSALCCLLRDPAGCAERSELSLSPESFHHPAHRIVFEKITELVDQRAKVDLVTLIQHLHDKGLLEEIGGAAALAEIADYVPTNALYPQYVESLEEKRVLRAIIGTCSEAIQRAHGEGEETGALLDEIEQQVLAVRQSGTRSSSRSLKEETMEAVRHFETMMSKGGATMGLPTGLKNLDAMTDGLHPGEMFVIAARPSMGKTSLAMNIVEHVACDEKQPSLVFSLEMGTQQLVQRLLCARGGVSMSKFREGFASSVEFRKIGEAARELAQSKLFIDDTPSISIMELRAKARRVHHQHPLKLIAIDYIQLLRSTSRRAQENRQIEIAEISAGIKALAKELSVPIIVLAQLNRNPEQRGGGRPRLSDLRESGSIEQDADVVGLLVREKYYAEDEEAREAAGAKAELIIAKQRNGPTGDCKLVFQDKLMRFGDRAKDEDEPN